MTIEACNRSKLISDVATKMEESGDLSDLIICEGESRILSQKSAQMQPFYQEFKPQIAAEVKELIGLPESLSTRTGAFSAADIMQAEMVQKKISKSKKQLPNKAILGRPIANRSIATFSKRATALPSKLIAVNRLIGDDVDEEEKRENLALARAATEAYIYGDTAEVAAWQPLIEAYLTIRGSISIGIPVFRNITVHNNATLNIASDTLAIYANRIKLYGNGKIDCQGPKTFHCTSFEGFL